MEAEDLQNALSGLWSAARTALRAEFTSGWLPAQFGLIVLAMLVAALAGAIVRRRFNLSSATGGLPAYLRNAVRALVANLSLLVFIAVVGMARIGIQVWAPDHRSFLLDAAVNLATAWVVIAILASLIRHHLINRVVAISAWTIAALSILGLLDATMAALDSRAIVIGGLRITALLVLKTFVLLLIALWAAFAASNFLERRVRAATELTPSAQVLIAKLIRIAITTVAIVFVLSVVGIDLSLFAWFTGAIGVGIGFGLQKIVGNLVSGIILLVDKSIKPGDMISVGDQFGWVTDMGARYTSVDTRDGREILVPNEDFITQHVVNWSYSNCQMMLEAKFGVSYDCDPHRVREIAVAAAASVPRVISDPAPICYFVNFGESSLDFSLRFWIADPNNGIINVRAPVMLALWDAFKREGIEIPYPVRDLRFGSAARVELAGEA
jgi:small-conductance mechanosensitive channel